jgi:Glycosyltransferase
MRLAFVDIENPEDVTTWSGIPYFILQELRRQSVDVEIIAPLKRSFRYWFAPHKALARLSQRNIQINRHPVALKSFAKQVEGRLCGRSFDAIFATSSIPISKIAPGIPVVYWTDAVTEAMVGYYTGAFASMNDRELQIAHAQEQAALDRASFAIYSSDWAANIVRSNYSVSGDKVRVIEFGANLPVNNQVPDIVAMNERRLSPPYSLLFIGVDWDRKGGGYAFEAAKILNEKGIKATLKVVGGAAPDAAFVENLGFINKNTREGQEQFRQLLATSTFFLLPTRAEAAGIVFCEASAYGLPTIATRTGGVENYVIDSQTGYCLPLSAGGTDYAELITKTLSQPDTFRQLSLSAFHRYQRKLNWTVGVSSMLELAKQARKP